jgi:hypothetical protein
MRRGFNSYVLSGLNFPSFQIEEHSPNITNLEFPGLENLKIPKNSSFNIEWTPENSLPENSQGYVVLYSSEVDSDEIISTQKVVNDSDGSVSFTSSDLYAFNNCPHLTILYGRGYNKTSVVEDKNIDLRFISISYSRIYLEK